MNFLAKRGNLEPGSELFGKAFENWCFHELDAYNLYTEAFAELSYWRLTSGHEVDFVINDLAVVIEAKAVSRITSDHLKGIRALKQDQKDAGRAIVVCLEAKARRTEEGIEIMPVSYFREALWAGEIF